MAANLPLSGYRVVDLTSVVLGPFCTQMLGDMGADVIKVETPEGDIMRHAGPMRSAGMGPIYMTINRNKRSITLDLKSASAKKILARLIETADVFVHNIRAGGIKRLGFDYESVKAIKPDVVYVHAVGFASGGPYEGRQAYDDLVQAASGMASMPPLQERKKEGREPPGPRYFPGLVADKTSGIFAANAVLAGLLHRERTGKGQFIEVPMLECMVSFNMAENLYGHTFVPPLGPTAYTRSINPNRRPYKTKDGYMALMPYSDANWRAFFVSAGVPELAEDERFSSYPARTKNIETLYGLIESFTVERTTADWLELLDQASVPCMRVHTLESILDDPQLRDTGFVEQRTHPHEGEYLAIHNPVTFDGKRSPVTREPPLLGQNNEEVLAEIGFGDPEIKAFKKDGAFGRP